MTNLLQATGSAIDAIRINRMERANRDGRSYWVKRRRNWSPMVLCFANPFFRAAENPVTVWVDRASWQRWEVECFQLLHGKEGFRAFAEEKHSVWAEELPGIALEEPGLQGPLTDEMLAASARELKRAHGLPCETLGGRWSHGDPHLGNFVFDEATRRARLIDFELIHRPGMPDEDRHADDLLVVFQSMMGYPEYAGSAADDRWSAAAALFLRHYRSGDAGEPHVFAQLHRRLQVPTGIGRVWWSIRTDYIPAAERNRRIAALRGLVGALVWKK